MRRRRLAEIGVGLMVATRAVHIATWLYTFFACVLVAKAPAIGRMKQMRTKTSHSNRFSAAETDYAPMFCDPYSKFDSEATQTWGF